MLKQLFFSFFIVAALFLGVACSSNQEGVDQLIETDIQDQQDEAVQPLETETTELSQAATATLITVPTATPTPTATVTPTPTPAPQIGETRINPETGQEEVFTDPGEWLEIVKIWNIVEMGELPRGLTKENASFEEREGIIILSWIQTNEEKDDFGQKYELLIPAHEEKELVGGLNGVKVPINSKFVLSIDGNTDPSVTMVSEKGETLSKWMTYEEKWEDIYFPVTKNSGQNEPQPWMPPKSGVMGIYTMDGDVGEFKIMSLMLQPLEVVGQKMFYGGKISKIIYWGKFNSSIDGKETILYIPLFNAEYDKTTMSGIFKMDENSGVDLLQNPFIYEYARLKELDEILELFEQSAVVNTELTLHSKRMVALYNQNKMNVPYNPNATAGFDRDHQGLMEKLELAYYPEKQQFFEQVFADEEVTVEELHTGYNTLSFLIGSESN